MSAQPDTPAYNCPPPCPVCGRCHWPACLDYEDRAAPKSQDTTPPAPTPAQPVKADPPQFLTDPVGWLIRHSFLYRWLGKDA
jgi:hypothetical protein